METKRGIWSRSGGHFACNRLMRSIRDFLLPNKTMRTVLLRTCVKNAMMVGVKVGCKAKNHRPGQNETETDVKRVPRTIAVLNHPAQAKVPKTSKQNLPGGLNQFAPGTEGFPESSVTQVAIDRP
jgi:hypothetical protein